MPDGILLIRKVCSVNPSVTLPDAEFKVMYADGTLIGDNNGIYPVSYTHLDVYKRQGVAYIRLNNGVNAIAHTCLDRRMPGKKDDVSFAVTKLDQERGVAVGIITRIIKQNL